MNDFILDNSDEIETEEEVEADELIQYLAKAVANSEGKPQIADTDALCNMAMAYKSIKAATNGNGAKVSYKTNYPFPSMGVIRVTGESVIYKDTGKFAEAIKRASNFNVYPKTDGKIQLDFTFHGLTKKL